MIEFVEVNSNESEEISKSFYFQSESDESKHQQIIQVFQLKLGHQNIRLCLRKLHAHYLSTNLRYICEFFKNNLGIEI